MVAPCTCSLLLSRCLWLTPSGHRDICGVLRSGSSCAGTAGGHVGTSRHFQLIQYRLLRSTICVTADVQVTRLCAVFLDAIGNFYGSITMPSPSPPPRPHASGGNPTEPAGFTGKAAVLDESDAVRLALLICSCYERTTARRRVCESTSEGTSNAADDVDDTTGDAASRKRRELLGLFYMLATSQLSRPGFGGSSAPVLGTPHPVQASAATLECDGKAALASGTSIHKLVVSASTSQGLNLALAAREQHDSPVNTNVSVPEPPVPCSSPPEPSPDGELHQVTRDRDLFRTRAYQLAFKVDDLHNRHSQTLCALERAEAVIEELQRDKMNAVVALASVVSATSSGHPRRSPDDPKISSSLSTIAFSPPSVSGHSTTSGSGAAPTSDARHLLADSHSQTAALDDVVLYPRTPTRCFTPAAGLVPTEPLLLPVVDDAARSLTPGGDLDGSWRKRATTWALSPRKESAVSAPGQAPSITKSLLGKIPWLRKGGRKHEVDHDSQDATEDELGVEVEAVKALRPLPSSWLSANPDTGLDCALEPEETAVEDGQVNLAGSAAGFGKGDEHSTLRGARKQHGLGTDGWNSSTTLHPSDDNRSSGLRRQSWVHREAGPQHGDYGAAQSAARRNGHSNLERNGSTKGPGIGMRTQRSTSSLSQNSYGRDGASRARTSTGPPQMLSDASVNWRAERVDGLEDDPEALDGSRHNSKSQSKSKRGRRSFGFGAGTTKADEMRRQNAPYFQGLQGQGPHLRRSQRCVCFSLFSTAVQCVLVGGLADVCRYALARSASRRARLPLDPEWTETCAGGAVWLRSCRREAVRRL